MSEKKKQAGKETSAETPVAKRGGDKGGGAAPAAYLIPANHPWAGMWKIWAGVAVVGLGMAGASYGSDPKRFAFAYLAAFAWAFTIAMGGLFFVLLQHITGAGWSVTVPRWSA